MLPRSSSIVYLQLYVVFRTCKPGVTKVCMTLNSPDRTGDLQVPASKKHLVRMVAAGQVVRLGAATAVATIRSTRIPSIATSRRTIKNLLIPNHPLLRT
jgi:hypothetical protein